MRGNRAFITALFLVGLVGTMAFALEEHERYANTPDNMIPYARQEPYKRYFITPLEYTGPGRLKAEPTDVDTVKIGWAGPLYRVVMPGVSISDRYYSMGQHALHGALLALEEANARGGYREKAPYALVMKNDPAQQVDDTWLWAPFTSDIVDMCYKDHVWALFGSISGENTHILIRIALKVEIPVMNSADTDPTFLETKIPWVFRTIADDRAQCYLLAKYAYEKIGYKRVAVLRWNGRYGRVGFKEFNEGSRRLGHPVILEVRYNRGDTDFSKQLAWIKRRRADALFTWGDDLESAHIVKQMKEMGLDIPVMGSDRMVTDRFLEIAGEAAEGRVVAGYPWDPTRRDPEFLAFRERYRERWNEDAETYAAHAYDGMNMLIQAIETAGLNRAKIRDALEDINPYEGVTGAIPFSPIYSDTGPICLAFVENGKWIFRTEDELGIPLAARLVKQ